jgi:DNA-binding MarR family transcriptional regulator
METSSIQICEDLLACLKRFKSELIKFGDAYHMTPMQLYALYAMQEQTATTMGQVAASLHCDASNVTGIVDRLVAQGLVVRQEDEHDRRTRTLRLTDQGVTVVREITAKLPKQLGCDLLDGSERHALHDILTKLVVKPSL